MKPELKQQLQELIKNSPTLHEERKEMILKALEYLNDEQGQKLLKLFQDAQKRYMDIESKYSGTDLEVKKQYLEKANEFTRDEITEAFHQWEKEKNKEEKKEIKQIEKQLDKLPE